MLNRSNAPWYTDNELRTLNAVVRELVAADRSEDAAVNLVHLMWFPGATADQLRRAAASHRDPVAGEPAEPDWQ